MVGAGGAVQWYTSAIFWRGFGAFFLAIINTFGWSTGATAAAISIQRLEGGMISPFVGVLLDRFGPRKLMMFGVAVTGLSFILMSRVQTLWQFYLVIVLLTVGMSFGTFIVIVATVGNWFIRKRVRALGILMSASALGGLTLPLLIGAIETYGWREVLFAAGVGFWIVGFPAALFMRRSPEDYGLLPDGDSPRSDEPSGSSVATSRTMRSLPRETAITARNALKMRFFWQLALASSLGQFVSASNLTHLHAFDSFGVGLGTAAIAVGAVAAGDLGGRAGMAFIGDRMDKRFMLAGAYAIQAIGILALALINANVLGFSLGLLPTPFYVIGFGLGFGMSIPLRLTILADYFGRRSYGSILGLTSSVNALFGAGGALFAGAMFDITGSYRVPFLAMAALLVLAVPLSMSLQSRERVAAIARRSLRRVPTGRGPDAGV